MDIRHFKVWGPPTPPPLEKSRPKLVVDFRSHIECRLKSEYVGKYQGNHSKHRIDKVNYAAPEKEDRTSTTFFAN